VTDEILTIKQVADYLKVNERTIYRLAGNSEIPAFKVGHSWRFKRSELELWIATQQADQHKTNIAVKADDI
jgi:excisionase family DNA binding protein